MKTRPGLGWDLQGASPGAGSQQRVSLLPRGAGGGNLGSVLGPLVSVDWCLPQPLVLTLLGSVTPPALRVPSEPTRLPNLCERPSYFIRSPGRWAEGGTRGFATIRGTRAGAGWRGVLWAEAAKRAQREDAVVQRSSGPCAAPTPRTQTGSWLLRYPFHLQSLVLCPKAGFLPSQLHNGHKINVRTVTRVHTEFQEFVVQISLLFYFSSGDHSF